MPYPSCTLVANIGEAFAGDPLAKSVGGAVIEVRATVTDLRRTLLKPLQPILRSSRTRYCTVNNTCPIASTPRFVRYHKTPTHKEKNKQ